MRRLLRILLNAATVLSLVLCAVTAAAWVRSYQAHDWVWWPLENQGLLSIGTYRGGLLAALLTDFLPPPAAGWLESAPLSYAEARGPQGTFFNRFGFALGYFQGSEGVIPRLACPFWFIILLTAILPAARLAGWRRRRARRLRLRPGLCQHCGYDCRATPDRCPECGRETNAATDAA